MPNCFFCDGNMKDGTTNHTVSFKDCIIIVRNVPCVECTQCGQSFFKDDVTSSLEVIVKSVMLPEPLTEVAIVQYKQVA